MAHWLDEDLRKQEVLIGLKRLKGPRNGENIATVIIPWLEWYNLAPKLGFFIGDNDSTNDTALKHLRPDIPDPDSRRVRYLGHIINLAAKAFLFSKDPDSFEANSRNKKERRVLKLSESSRAHGLYRKFHNTIHFVRITPQRRDKWSEIANGRIEEDLECKLPFNFTFWCQDQTPRAWRLANLGFYTS